MLSLCTPDAVVLSTTANHLAWLGRDREDVIGHRCSEWASPDHWDLNWYLFQRSYETGMPLFWHRAVLRADGTAVQGHVMVRPVLTRRRTRVMMCVNSIVDLTDAPDLRVDIGASLAELHHFAPIEVLRPSFEELAAYAADAVAIAQTTADGGRQAACFQ